MSAPIQKSGAKTKAATQVVTANRLIDGVVVYLDAAGGWTERIGRAMPIVGAEALDAAVAAGKQAEADRIVVETYPIDVEREEGGFRPTRLREVIRAAGPTVREDFARPTSA